VSAPFYPIGLDTLAGREFGTEPIRTAAKLIVGPTAEPLTPADAKAHYRQDFADDDALVPTWITAARRKVEQDTGRALMTQTWDLFLDGFPRTWRPIELPWPPLQSVTGVYATDATGVEQTVDPAIYVVDTASEPARLGLVNGAIWPTDLRRFQPGRVRLVAGYASAAAIAEELRRAMALVIGWLAQNREPQTFERDAYDALIAPYVLPVVG
jgi:uncharacterized phiE125 gp8 family phage protein